MNLIVNVPIETGIVLGLKASCLHNVTFRSSFGCKICPIAVGDFVIVKTVETIESTIRFIYRHGVLIDPPESSIDEFGVNLRLIYLNEPPCIRLPVLSLGIFRRG
jgi:hypothetical protein